MTFVYLAALALQQPSQNPFSGSLFMIVSMVLIWYFLLIRPQQKQRKSHEGAVLNLKRGDRIVTNGGIVGEVVHIKQGADKEGQAAPTMDDEVTVKSGESRLIVERGRIAKIAGAAGVSTSKDS